MQDRETYEYVGYDQSRNIHKKETKDTLNKIYRSRRSQILNSQLYGRNKIKEIHTYAIPILTFLFGVIKSQTEIHPLQRNIHSIMTKHRKHHPRSCVQRLTLPREYIGRGLIDIKNLHNNQLRKLRTFFHFKSSHSSLHHLMTQADEKLTPLAEHSPRQNSSCSLYADKRYYQKLIIHSHPLETDMCKQSKQFSLFYQLQVSYLHHYIHPSRHSILINQYTSPFNKRQLYSTHARLL